MTSILESVEPNPVTIERPAADSPFFFTCDHAANRVPGALDNLGLSAADRQRHIAWDIGAASVARCLAQQLNATLVLQNYSRLVIDCNRPIDSDQLIPSSSERIEIPGNHSLDEQAAHSRRVAIYEPYHDAICDLLDRRVVAKQATVFVAIHSFTPVYLGVPRPWHVGILYGADERMAVPMLQRLKSDNSLCCGDNDPYQIDHNDYGIPIHGDARQLPNVLIEIRQDLIELEAGQREWAARLAAVLSEAFETLSDR